MTCYVTSHLNKTCGFSHVRLTARLLCNLCLLSQPLRPDLSRHLNRFGAVRLNRAAICRWCMNGRNMKELVLCSPSAWSNCQECRGIMRYSRKSTTTSACFAPCHEGCNRIKHTFCDMLCDLTLEFPKASASVWKTCGFSHVRLTARLLCNLFLLSQPLRPDLSRHLNRFGAVRLNRAAICRWCMNGRNMKELVLCSPSAWSNCQECRGIMRYSRKSTTTSACFAPFPHAQWLNCWLLSEKGFYLCLPKHPEDLGAEP